MSRDLKKELAILQKITDSIAYNLELGSVLSEIVEIIHKETSADSVFIYVYDEPSARLTLKASKNPHPSLLGKISLNLGEGITGWVAQHKKPVEIANNASDDPRFRFFHNIPEDKYEAFLSLPVTARNRLVGVINIQYKKPKRHEKSQIDLLLTIAKQVGGAIENARLFAESQALSEALEARKLVDRAKAILIKKDGLSEADAYLRMQKLSMKLRKPVKEIAEAIIISSKVEKS